MASTGFPVFFSAVISSLRSCIIPEKGKVLVGGDFAAVEARNDFITVTKLEDEDWQVLKPQVLGVVMEHYTSGRPMLLADDSAPEGDGEEDDEIVTQIKELLDTRVRPAVAQDGGDIIFERFEDGVVYLHMQGACAGCPSSTATLKHGIENMLRYYVPEVEEVRPAGQQEMY